MPIAKKSLPTTAEKQTVKKPLLKKREPGVHPHFVRISESAQKLYEEAQALGYSKRFLFENGIREYCTKILKSNFP